MLSTYYSLRLLSYVYPSLSEIRKEAVKNTTYLTSLGSIMSTDYSWHAIAVGNRLLGLYNFAVLKAPPTWRIIIMPMASDVFKHREIYGVKWVRDGEVMHFIKDGSNTYTLRVVVKPGRKRLTGTPIVVNGHSGAYEYIDDGKRRVLKLSFYCDVTDRTVEIKIEGVKDTTPLYYLSQSQCR